MKTARVEKKGTVIGRTELVTGVLAFIWVLGLVATVAVQGVQNYKTGNYDPIMERHVSQEKCEVYIKLALQTGQALHPLNEVDGKCWNMARPDIDELPPIRVMGR